MVDKAFAYAVCEPRLPNTPSSLYRPPIFHVSRISHVFPTYLPRISHSAARARAPAVLSPIREMQPLLCTFWLVWSLWPGVRGVLTSDYRIAAHDTREMHSRIVNSLACAISLIWCSWCRRRISSQSRALPQFRAISPTRTRNATISRNLAQPAPSPSIRR